MVNLLDKINELNLSRRSFLKASTAAAAALSLGGCANTLTTASPDQMANGEGEWRTAACWHNCGSRCLNKALVVDGVVVRQKQTTLIRTVLIFPSKELASVGVPKDNRYLAPIV